MLNDDNPRSTPRSGNSHMVMVPLWALIIIIVAIVGLFIALMAVLGVAVQRGHTTAAAGVVKVVPGPTKTVVVTKDHTVSTGISTSKFDACSAAYDQVSGLLKDQTGILSGVSTAASDALTAASQGDPAGLDTVNAQVQTYTQMELDLQSRQNSVDTSACSR